MNDCVFCAKIREGTVWDTPDTRVATFVPLRPVTEGHRLFVPRKHVADAGEDPSLTGVVMQQAAGYAASRHPSFNLITSVGEPATQSIFHLHVHVVPRVEGDGMHLPWTAASPTP